MSAPAKRPKQGKGKGKGKGKDGRTFDLALVARLFPFVRQYGRGLLVSITLLPLISGFEIAQPYLLKRAIDEHIAPHRLPGLDRLAVLYLLALIGQYGAAFAHNYLVQIVGQRAMSDLRLAVHRHVLRLSAAFFDRTPIGQLMTRMTNDIESLTELFASGVISLLGDVVRLGLIIFVMFRTDGRLALFSMAAVPLLAVIAMLFRGWMRDAFREIRSKLSRMNGFLQEHLSGIKVVQSFAQERRVADEFTEVNQGYRNANARAIAADAALYSVVEAVASIAVASLLWRGGARIAAGGLSFGVLVQFIEYLGKFFAPLRDLSAKVTVMQQAMTAAERVFGILDTPEIDHPPAHAPSMTAVAEAAPAVEFRHVTFGYREGVPILRDLSLAIRRGETLAVVGASGAGKSTLIKLLPGLYYPQQGAILLDGVDIRDLETAALRRRVVVVNQDVFLFAGTLADNIGLGDPAATPAALMEAARRVGADRVIAARPEGLDAPVLERGANFSAGERQLIAFARALYRDPHILVLDEATASVDPEVERIIERGIAELMRDRTSIVIAHRLSTVRRADRIIVVDRGCIAEEGCHDDLLALDGTYAKLYRLQMQHPSPGRRNEAAE
ncbi:MAG TPA: ABC transporter ATP-binding protein [Polyangia bacterium]|jgi:ATP-binding cassette subfamily B protein